MIFSVQMKPQRIPKLTEKGTGENKGEVELVRSRPTEQFQQTG